MIVTVVTPTFNAQDYLIPCIETVKRNHSPNFEVDHVIVDGGSSDNTVDIARKAGVRLITGKDDGIFDAINKGSFNSQGDLLGFLGADDTMLDGALEAIVSAYKRSNAAWVVGGIDWIDNDGRTLGSLAAPPAWMTARMHACLGWNPVMHMSTYINRDMFQSLGGFDIRYRDASDYDMFVRALRMAPFARVGRSVGCFRRTGQNNSVVHAERSRAESERILEQYGPKSTADRIFYRYLLKTYFNARNPKWMARKVKERAASTVAPQVTVRHF